MDILIVGAGSIEVYLGTLLNSKGCNVFLLRIKKFSKEVALLKEKFKY